MIDNDALHSVLSKVDWDNICTVKYLNNFANYGKKANDVKMAIRIITIFSHAEYIISMRLMTEVNVLQTNTE